ncbi:MAG: amidohydrolase family protein [Pirellulales bacterium]|nr:amidohydrolase family protein [Pirellulales bacterium]
MKLVARRFDTGRVCEFSLSDGRIESIRPLDSAQDEHLWIAPGFVDIQVNGYGGQEFSSADLTIDAIERIAAAYAAGGVTRFCPTLTTNSYEALEHGVRTIAVACRQSAQLARQIVGIHLEGPYLSPEDGPRGAHPAEHCRPPDWEEFARLQAAADGRIAIVTLSPEYAKAPAFIRLASSAGICVALGHLSATGQQIRAAVDAGARLSTHLGNGAHRLLRRHPNYLWDQLAEDRLWASLIVDGQHLPPEVVKTFVRAKGPERLVLVSDLSGLAGLPPGRYQSSGCELEVLADGRLVIAGQDQLLAGASRTIAEGVANIIEFADLNLPTAIGLATSQPCRLLELPPGRLQPGDTADLVLFDFSRRRIEVRATLLAGQAL